MYVRILCPTIGGELKQLLNSEGIKNGKKRNYLLRGTVEGVES